MMVFALRALPVTFFVFVLEAIVATVFALPWAVEAQRRVLTPLDASARAALLDTLGASDGALRVVALQAALVFGLWVAFAPWLQMAWLSAIAQPMGPGRALSRGVRLFARAVAVGVCVWSLTALLAAPFGLGAWTIVRVCDPMENARAHDLAIALCLDLIVPVLFVGHTWRDLARARALSLSTRHSVTRSARDAFRPCVLARALLLSATGFALVAGAEWVAGKLGTGSTLDRVLVLALVQLTIFARLFLRSVWLAGALACADVQAGAASFPLQRDR